MGYLVLLPLVSLHLLLLSVCPCLYICVEVACRTQHVLIACRNSRFSHELRQSCNKSAQLGPWQEVRVS